jgi:membrane protein YdbS with pleckstrin-like domain
MIKNVPGVKNGEFRPAPQFKTLYYAYLVLVIIFAILPWFAPIAVFAPYWVTTIFLLPLLIIFAVVIFWIPYYYDTIIYRFTETEMEWRRGVWFRQTGIVPYNRITNVDISQGPLARALGIASLNIHTAGYSAASGAGGTPELKVVGVEHFEELRDMVMEFVRSKKPVAVETFEGVEAEEKPQKDVLLQILEELKKMRELMEKSQR